MRLLILSNNTDRASFRQRVAVYIDTLKANGIDSEVVQLPPWILSRRNLFMKARDFDAVFLHKKTLNPFDSYYLKKFAKKIIYDFDDAVMYDDSHPERPHHKRQNSFERTVRLADLVIAGNEYLAGHARKFISNVEILPTGLNTAEYQIPKPKSDDDKIRLVWIGSRPTLPHLKQIVPALGKIGKRFDNVVLRIICDEFLDVRNMDVEECLWMPQTEADDLVSSDIGLSPLEDNAFTRGKCGFKILQYQAASLPVIASPVGVNAELVRDGLNGYLAVSAADWVEKIAALVENKPLRMLMGEAAAATVRNFNLNTIGPKFVAMVKSAIGGS